MSNKNYNGLINIDYPEYPYIVYTITSIDTNDLSIYIGISANYIQRAAKHGMNRNKIPYKNKQPYIWMNHVIDVKGLNIIFRIIEKGYTEEQVLIREMELVKMYKELGYNVLNLTDGGKGLTGRSPWNKGKIIPEDIKKKYSESHVGIVGGMKGKNHSEKTKKLISLKNQERKERNWHNPRKKKVYKYNPEGQLIKIYSSLIDAGKAENSNPTSIGEWCRGVKSPRNEFMWSYENFYN